MQTIPNGVGKRKEFTVAIEFDGLSRRIKNDLAVIATLKVKLQSPFQIVVQIPVQIAGNLLERVFTIHEYLTSFKDLA